MTTKKIIARELLDLSTEKIWNELRGNFILVFDDGEEIETNWVETAYSSYAWDIVRRYPKTPLLARHHVKSVIGEESITTSTHLRLLEIVWDVYDTYPDIDRDILAQFSYQATNTMYNDFSVMFDKYASSIDILDFMDILDHPEIKEANNNVEPTEASIEKTYQVIDRVLRTDPGLKSNPLVRAMKSKTIKDKQLLQTIGPRGFLTDIDSTIFPHPILKGYAEGLNLFHDQLIESRSASKSLMFSKKPLQDAEYFSRKLQLLDQNVHRVHKGDCGSTGYISWTVRGKVFDEKGKKIFGGDLPLIAGKWYLDQTTGKLKVVREHDKHLIGKTIQMRTVLECCHPDPYGICSKCFGELSLAVFEQTNIGHMACTSMTQKSSQSVLSVKHLDGSSAVDRITIDPAYKDYLTTDREGISYLIAPNLFGPLKLIMTPASVPNITDLREITGPVSSLSIGRTSSMNEIGILIETDGFENITSIPVGFDHRPASLTYDALEYIRQKGWTINAEGNYVIDMSSWDRNKPLLTLPLRHYNMSDHSKEIADMIQSTVRDLKIRDKIESPHAALIEFYELVNNRLEVNLATLEIVIYGAMIVSAENYDYRLPKPGGQRGMGVMKMMMSYRSLSAAMAYQGHQEVLSDPVTYLLEERPDHPMDFLLMPLEVNPQYQ